MVSALLLFVSLDPLPTSKSGSLATQDAGLPPPKLNLPIATDDKAFAFVRSPIAVELVPEDTVENPIDVDLNPEDVVLPPIAVD